MSASLSNVNDPITLGVPHTALVNKTFVYEVNLTINKDVFEKNGDWFIDHIQEMVSTKHFIKAEVCREIILDPTDDSLLRVCKITVKYYLESYEQLKAYLAAQALGMRSMVAEKFGGNYNITRRVFFLEKHIDRTGHV